MQRRSIKFVLHILPGLIILLIFAQRSGADVNKLHPYPSPEQREQEVIDLAQKYPDRVFVSDYGKSVEGRPLTVFKISRPGQKDKPAVWMGSVIHGNEWIGNRMVMNVARTLLEQDGKDPLVTEAMDNLDFYFSPCINPDGYNKTWENPDAQGKIAEMGATYSSSGKSTEGDWGHTRKNANRVDLNRNWPIPGKVYISIDWAGSPDPDSVHYRGTSPLSEPENKNLDIFMKEHPEIIAGISFHSTGSVLFPPHCPSRKCMKKHKKMCSAFKENQVHRKYPRIQSRVFDTYTGELEDWLYAEYGMLCMDIEISHTKPNQKACNCDDLFWTFNPAEPGYWLENDSRAAIAAMLEANKISGGKRIPKKDR
jgi:Zinc carboxypeptidase